MTYMDTIGVQFRWHWCSNAWTPWSRHTARDRAIEALIITDWFTAC